MAETKTPPRDMCQLINAMRLFVPPTEQALLERLKAVYSAAMYSAPELQPLRWGDLHDVIVEHFPTITTESPEWHKAVICLFSNTTRHKCDEILAREQELRSEAIPVEVIGSYIAVKELLTEEGVPSRPFKLLSDSYIDLSSVAAISLAGMRVGVNTTVKLPHSLQTLDGVHCEYAVILRNCDGVKTLGNAFFESRVRLEQLCGLRSLGTATFGNAVELHGMPDGVDLGTPDLSDDELRIVQQIELDKVEMTKWHTPNTEGCRDTAHSCGTAHCLAGWAEFIYCRDKGQRMSVNGDAAYELGCVLLPHLSHLFFAVKCKQSVREMLVRLQAVATERLKQ